MAEEINRNEENKKYKYIAFISYRHLHPDIEVAKAIHTMVETFRLPKEFYKDIGTENLRVFRDREELSTSSLSNSIQDALKNSKYLIVICSKRFRDSVWCNIEVETFIKLHGIHRVIPVLIEGEPYESFPTALLADTDEVDLDAEEKKDILAAELRSEEVKSAQFRGFADLEKTDPSKVTELGKKAVKLLKDEKYRIMAGILGVSYGDLKQREKVRWQRRIIMLSSVISLSLLFFGIFMLRAYISENAAKRQTIQDKSYFMLEEAQRLIKEGDRYKALIISDNAMNEMDDKMESYSSLKAKHLSIMNRSLDVLKTGYNRVIETNNRFTFMDINSKNDTFVAGYNNDSVGIWNVETGNLIKASRGHTQQVKIVQFSDDDKKIVSGGFDDVINIWDAEKLEILKSVKADGNIMHIEFTHDGKSINVIYDGSDSFIYQKYDASTLAAEGKPLKLYRNIKRVAFDRTSDNLWVVYDTYAKDSSLIKYDLKKGTESKRYKDILSDSAASDPQNKDLTIPYDDLRTADGEFLFVRAGSRLLRLDPLTDNVVYTINGLFGGISGNINLAVRKENNEIYVADGIMISKLSLDTGKKIKEISLAEPASEMKMTKDGKMIAVLGDKGNISIVRDDILSEVIRDESGQGAEYLYMTTDGKNLMGLSLKNQQIRIIKMNQDMNTELKEGQIVAHSSNSRYALIYSGEKLIITDVDNDKAVREINHEFTDSLKIYVRDGMGYSISGDGKYLGGFYLKKPAASSKEEVHIFVLDTENNKVVSDNITDLKSFYLGFSDDSSMFYLNTSNDEITVYSTADGKEKKKIRFDKGSYNNFIMSGDNRYIAVNYVEAISDVYSLDTGEKASVIPGEIISFGVEGQDLVIRSIYNNTGSTYRNFVKEGTDVNLGKDVDLSGDDLSRVNLYNPEKHLLAAVRNQKDDYTAYLIDFNTGDLIQTLGFSSSAYKMKAMISEKGDYLLTDSYFGYDKTGDSDYKYYLRYERYPIFDYDKLKGLSEKVTETIEFSDSEKKELNIR